jgi:XTP/dITP diphosphohydrolase
MNRLLIATTNPAKLAEYRLLLRGLKLELLSLRELGITDEAPESGSTFAKNAELKAGFYFARVNIATLADDGGLEVDALGGAPGVRSHRWLSEGRAGHGLAPADDRMLAEEVIRRMAGIESARRTARLRAAAALAYLDGGLVRRCVAEATLEGVIADRCYPNVRPGFPYRAVLFLPAYGRYLAELSEEEAARLSQRRALVQQLIPSLKRLVTIG